MTANLYFYYDDIYEKGGAPLDYLTLAQYLQLSGSQVYCNVRAPVGGGLGYLSTVEFLSKAIREKGAGRTSSNQVVIIGFSSLKNSLVSMLCYLFGVSVVLLPVNQVNRFLDFDNPFSKGDVPIVSEIVEGTVNIKEEPNGRVAFGRRTAYSWCRSFLRWGFRCTFGGAMVNCSSKIGVFSTFEENEVVSFYPNSRGKIFHYSLGSEVNSVADDGVGFNEPDKINILMWCRLDLYYKGILDVLTWIDELDDRCKASIALNIAGPDYRSGRETMVSLLAGLKESTRSMIHLYLPEDYGVGSLSLLSKADYILSASKWDGFPRTLREAHNMNRKLIVNHESNFDDFMIGGVDFLYDGADEFLAVLRSLVDDTNVISVEKSQISWGEAAVNFNANINK